MPNANDTHDTCVACGGETILIAYGYPGPEMFEAAERGEIELGGCTVFHGKPTRRCRSCGAESDPRPAQ